MPIRILALGLAALLGGCHLLFSFDIPELDTSEPDGGLDLALDADPDLTPDGPHTIDLPLIDLPPADLPPPDLPANDLPPLDKGPKPDGGPTPTCQKIGKPCSGAGDCAGGTCLILTGAQGVCTCACTPDDPSTPMLNEDTCPNMSVNVCGAVSTPAGVKDYCFQTCLPKLGANDCQKPLACSPAAADNNGDHKPVCAAVGCAGNADCPVFLAKPCVTASACSSGETCRQVYPGVSLTRCAKPGVCDATSGLCALKPGALSNAAAKVGDPCTSDLNCGAAMTCMVELNAAKYRKAGGQSCSADDECCSNQCLAGACVSGPCPVYYRNGYCTVRGCASAGSLTIRACPVGSVCNHLYAGGLCQRTCTLTTKSTCRGYNADYFGDYECRNWSNISIQTIQVTSGPVCDFGPALPCSFWSSTPMDCSAVGESKTNGTNMRCRSYDNKTLTKHDTSGLCLDDTPSSATFRSPLP